MKKVIGWSHKMFRNLAVVKYNKISLIAFMYCY